MAEAVALKDRLTKRRRAAEQLDPTGKIIELVDAAKDLHSQLAQERELQASHQISEAAVTNCR